jgi:hypothetical protein
VKRVLGGALTAILTIVVASAAPWGCVTDRTKEQRAQRARASEVPDGGWQNYMPPSRDYKADPYRKAADSPITQPVVPVTPGSSTVSPNVH